MYAPSPEQYHEWNFNPRAAVPDADRFTRRAQGLSLQARGAMRARLDLRYGEGELASLDVFPAEDSGAPLHVYLHGGYWRGRDKSDYSYLARALVPAGIATVVMNYDLCPAASLPGIVAQVRAGLGWVHANARALGGDPARLSLSGHSAGAHLAAMALAADGEDALPAGVIRGAVLVSGIYELTPVLGVSVNEEIRLGPEQVGPMSPLRHPPRADVPLWVAVGGDEPPGWIEQSRRFAQAARANGSTVTYREVAGHHHFSIMTLLEDAHAPLSRMVIEAARGDA